MDSFIDDVKEKIKELKRNDFEPSCVVISPEKHAKLLENYERSELENKIALEIRPYTVINNIEKDFVVCFEDEIEESPLALPSPDQINDRIVENLEFNNLEPEVAEEEGYENITEDDLSLKVNIFADIERKGIDVLEENIEELGLDPEDFPLEEEEKEADEDFTEQIEFAVVSKDFRNEENEDFDKEKMKDAMKKALRDQIAETIYSGTYIYPYSYQPSEDLEPKRVGEEYYEFNKIMMPQADS